MKYIQPIFVSLKIICVKYHCILLLLFLSNAIFGQVSEEENQFLARLVPSNALPEKLLNTRTAVFYTYAIPSKQLDDIQQSFQRTGIDAVVYFETDALLAGKDITTAFAAYLSKRDITNLVFIQKNEKGYKMFITTFNTKNTIVEENQYAWTAEDTSLSELLTKLYRAAGGGIKRQNMLINDFPEKDLTINPILGRRSDFFAIDMKVDELAIPKTGDEAKDKALEEIFSTYPFKHKFTEPGVTDQEIRKKGSLFVLCYVHTRGRVAKELLGYDMSKGESALVSVTYPDNASAQLKNIPADQPVYKFYFRHIDSGDVFLGTKWDADLTWQQALKNQLKGFKIEFKIE